MARGKPQCFSQAGGSPLQNPLPTAPVEFLLVPLCECQSLMSVQGPVRHADFILTGNAWGQTRGQARLNNGLISFIHYNLIHM
ncbi:hypothetical protein AAFF_G00330820 [Aldrovandia affinis]|uniref:Uncharacterized protein n=1 Tax=Aldrovandia affinis TaxID=143900 RepID=A0AAD7R6F2_9TELE|nr:hypothetical protein AAFF_G00330820 [Aldrovandia affinis]